MKVNKKNLHKEKNGILIDILAHNRIPFRVPKETTNEYKFLFCKRTKNPKPKNME